MRESARETPKKHHPVENLAAKAASTVRERIGRTMAGRIRGKGARKGAALLLAMLLLAFPFSLVSATAFAAGNATVTVESTAEPVKPGDTFTVPVNITGNPGFAGVVLTFAYDSAALELASFDSRGALFDGGALENAPKDTIGFFGVTIDRTGDGTLFKASFKVKPTAAEGDYELSVSIVDDKPSNFVNAESKPVPVAFAAGTVTVSKDGTATDADSGSTSGSGAGGAGTANGVPAAKGPDADEDGLADADEAKLGTNPSRADSDGDGYTDGEEALTGSDPTDKTITPGAVALAAGSGGGQAGGDADISAGAATGTNAATGTSGSLNLLALVPWLISGAAAIAILIGLFLLFGDRRRQRQKEGART
jgi:hypothetical protein